MAQPDVSKRGEFDLSEPLCECGHQLVSHSTATKRCVRLHCPCEEYRAIERKTT